MTAAEWQEHLQDRIAMLEHAVAYIYSKAISSSGDPDTLAIEGACEAVLPHRLREMIAAERWGDGAQSTQNARNCAPKAA